MATALAMPPVVRLPALVRQAADALAGATSAAEVLDARDTARMAYDAAKSAGRFVRAKRAHDEVISAVYRAQADALEIESMAKRRLADEFDVAQKDGDVGQTGRPKSVGDVNAFRPATAADIGLSRFDIHEARQLRDAEEADPGIVRRTLDTLIQTGAEPTKAAVKAAIQGGQRPRVSDDALFIWGRLRDFEKRGLFGANPAEILSGMTRPMRAEVVRLCPIISQFLNSLEAANDCT